MISYKRYQSYNDNWYDIPDDENYSAQKTGYEYAVIIKDEKMMLWFEEGNTGWILVEDE